MRKIITLIKIKATLGLIRNHIQRVTTRRLIKNKIIPIFILFTNSALFITELTCEYILFCFILLFNFIVFSTTSISPVLKFVDLYFFKKYFFIALYEYPFNNKFCISCLCVLFIFNRTTLLFFRTYNICIFYIQRIPLCFVI